jgi:hypothetical protein
MNKLTISRAALAFRVMANKLHPSSLVSCTPKTCGLLLIVVLGLIQMPTPSVAKARPKARLVFDTSYTELVNQGSGFSNPTGIGTTTGKSIRKLPEGDAVYSWKFPETISPAGATFQIGVAARANNSGGGISAVIGWIGNYVQEQDKPSEVSVGAKPGEGLKKASETFTIIPKEAYESPQVLFKIRCHGGFDVVFRYNVEQ